MGALDPAKILVILVVALVVLGPERLPRVAREVGGVWRELTKMRNQVVSEIRDAIPDDLPSRDDLPRFPRPSPGAVSGFVSGLMAPSSKAPDEETELVPDDPDGASAVASEQRDEIAEYSEQFVSTMGSASSTIDRDRHFVDNRSLVVIHHELGEFACLPDDPNMN